jgi:hypothetical protein
MPTPHREQLSVSSIASLFLRVKPAPLRRFEKNGGAKLPSVATKTMTDVIARGPFIFLNDTLLRRKNSQDISLSV